jgi:hypothetical protein
VSGVGAGMRYLSDRIVGPLLDWLGGHPVGALTFLLACATAGTVGLIWAAWRSQ